MPFTVLKALHIIFKEFPNCLFSSAKKKKDLQEQTTIEGPEQEELSDQEELPCSKRIHLEEEDVIDIASEETEYIHFLTLDSF